MAKQVAITQYYSRGEKKWRYDYYIGKNPYTNKPVRLKKSGFATKSEAKSHLQQAIADYDEKSYQYSKIKFSQVFQEFIDYH